MKAACLLLAAAVSLSLPNASWAQRDNQNRRQNAEKGPADVAFDEFRKQFEQAAAKPDQTHFRALVTAAFVFVEKYPTQRRTPDVLKALSTFGEKLNPKTQAAIRAAWLAQLKYEILSEKTSDRLDDDGRAAVASLDASVADYDVRLAPNRETLANFRGKIDTLAEMPGGARFLQAHEVSYVEILERMNPAAAEAHLQKLTSHTDRNIATIARDELNVLELRKAPYELKFTALDGKECDLAQLRGKVVALVFWATTNQTSTRELLALRETYSELRKRGFEIVTVSYDKPEQRDAVAKFVMDNKVTWPVYFDGKGDKNEFGGKLNVRRLPAVALFDKKGILAGTGLRANEVRPGVAQLLGVKLEAPREDFGDDDGGGGGGGGNRRGRR
jgi:peroxiredoxin